MTDRPILLVTGLGRCGTSLVMQMLDAGGYPVVGTWPDYEDAVSMKPGSPAFMAAAQGRAVKVLDAQRFTLPRGPRYRWIWLSREISEQARSMLKLSGASQDRHNRRAMEASLRRDTPAAKMSLMRAGAHLDAGVLELTFEALLRNPAGAASGIARYVGQPLDTAAMAKCVRPRSALCLPYLMELEMIA